MYLYVPSVFRDYIWTDYRGGSDRFNLHTLWEETNCGHRGSCWIYDNELLSYYITIVCAMFAFLKFVFLLMALKFYKQTDNM